MLFRTAFAALLAASLFGPELSWAQPHVGYAVDKCGGVMTGFDGSSYTCARDRLPVCDQDHQHCVCLARVECGAKKNEPY